MDAIESLDWGTYAHFRFQAQQLGLQAKQFPATAQVMQDYYSLGSYVVAGLFIVLTILLFLLQKKHRSALVALLTFGAAVALIEGVRHLVPRRRPPDAQDWLGADHMLGSYPSTAVFLLMLSMILLGFAGRDLVQRRWLRGVGVLLAMLLTVAVCMSQFFLALHFLTDIIGGIVGAAAFGLIAGRFLKQPQADNQAPTPA